MKVKELLRTVNGDAGGPPGAGIDARFHASRRNNPAVGTTSSFNLSMGACNSTNRSTVSQQEEISELRSECAWLRERVEELMRIPQRGRFEQGTRAVPSVDICNVVQRLAILEDRQEAGTISMGGIKFSSERDCIAFVSEHLTGPNFSLLTDMVSWDGSAIFISRYPQAPLFGLPRCTNPCLCMFAYPLFHTYLGSEVNDKSWIHWSGNCCRKECGRLLRNGAGLFCANFCHQRGPFQACRSAWCDGCYEKHPDDDFRVIIPLDEDREPMKKGDDEFRFQYGRSGDQLSTAFQCDVCHVRNMLWRDPRDSDRLLMKCLRRAILDSLWRREPGTMSSTYSRARALERYGNVLGTPKKLFIDPHLRQAEIQSN
jgi:hypothetical protein